MNDATLERLEANVKTLHKAASTWVIVVVSTVASVFFALSPEQQAAIWHALPISAPFLPLVTGVAALVAKVVPQAFAFANSSSSDKESTT